MDIKLSGEYEQLVKLLVETGDFDDKQEVIHVALLLLKETWDEEQSNFQKLKASILEAMAQPGHKPYSMDEIRKLADSED